MRQETKLGDGADGSDGVWVDREVVQVLCKSFFQSEPTKTCKFKDLVTLT